MRSIIARALLLAAAFPATGLAAEAPRYPVKPVRWVVPSMARPICIA